MEETAIESFQTSSSKVSSVYKRLQFDQNSRAQFRCMSPDEEEHPDFHSMEKKTLDL